MSEAVPLTEELQRMAEEAAGEIGQAGSAEALEQLRVKWLGRKSRLTEVMKSLPSLAPEQRAPVGKGANQFKAAVESQLGARRQALAGTGAPALDVTLPGRAVPQGRLHPITVTLRAILELFVPMGFEIVEGPEAELEYYNFDGLNIPADHPSRESFDTFFLDAPSPEP